MEGIVCTRSTVLLFLRAGMDCHFFCLIRQMNFDLQKLNVNDNYPIPPPLSLYFTPESENN